MECLLKHARILVTGGAGFIGSHLAETLLRQNQVTVLDNFSTGRRENLASFLDHPDFTLMEGDIRDPETCCRAAENMDYIFHQAALGSVPRSIAEPETSVHVNVSGTVNVFSAAVRAKTVKRLIYASSSSVYGDSPELPKREDRTGRPLSPYAAAKSCCELFADVFSRTYGLECIGLRYFNVFGPRQNPAGPYAAVIPAFLTAMLRHEPPVIHGDGTYSRDFTYVENAVLANQLAALAEKEAVNRVYNIAAGQQTDLNELFLLLRSVLAEYDPEIAKLEACHDAVRPGDVPRSLASTELAEQFLRYRPVCGVAEGLRKTVQQIFL